MENKEYKFTLLSEKPYFFLKTSFMPKKFAKGFSKHSEMSQLCTEWDVQIVLLLLLLLPTKTKLGHYRLSSRSPELGEKLPGSTTGTHLSLTDRRKCVSGNGCLFRGLGNMRIQGSFFCVCAWKRVLLSKTLES